MRASRRAGLAVLPGMLTLLLTLMLVPHIARAQRERCRGETSCYDTPAFQSVVTDFRASASGGVRLITATLRLVNRTPRPLVLGYVDGSAIVTDDQGNRYQVSSSAAVRGMGVITANAFDPKFQLQPGEQADARFELAFRPANRSVLLGTRYTMELAIREITPLAGSQWRLGREHALRYNGFDGTGAVVRAAAADSAAGGGTSGNGATITGSTAAPTPMMTPAAEVDLCAGTPRCYGSGPIRVDIAQLSASDVPGGRYHQLQVNVRVRNMATEPIILGYRGTSSGATDNLGNRYYFGRPGTHDVSASGIGVVTGQTADPQFALRPGESRNAVFTVTRFDAGRNERGTAFTWNATFVQLEITPSRQVRAGREFAVQIADVSPSAGDAVKAAGSSAANRATKAVLDALKKKPPVR